MASKTITVSIDPFALVRRATSSAYRTDMADGRRQRATTFRSAKGKGSYSRKPKHRAQWS